MRKISKSKIQTQKIAKELARQCPKQGLGQRAVVIGLSGELGSGKTTFVQGFTKSLGIKKRIISPTFVLMKRYKNLYHIDCYRIDSYKEILDLGWKDMLTNKENIILVEWAEKIKKIFPKSYVWIKFTHKSLNQRGIDIRFLK